MSIESPITADLGWHRFETKALRITVTDASNAAVDLDGVALQWLLLRQAGDPESRAYMNKATGSGITVEGDDDNVVVISIDDSEYDPAPAGVYYHELWDRDSDVMLCYGDVVLLPGTKDEA